MHMAGESFRRDRSRLRWSNDSRPVPPCLKVVALEVQIFGTAKNQDTRKALRFFSERRIKTHFVDLKERAASRGELTRFAQKFGISALIDRDSTRYRDLGLGVVRYDDERWLQLLCDEPLVLYQPLVRYTNRLTVGHAEAEWKAWIAGEKAR